MEYYDRDGIADIYDSCPYDSANDVDKDGICGNVDSCPYEKGVASNGGCHYDRDGIADIYDSCPYDSANDVDKDGICGNVDSCPYEKGVASNGGCPAPKPVIKDESSWFDNIPTGLVNTKTVQPKLTCGAGTELVNGKCQTIQKSNPTTFDSIPTGLVNTKTVQPKLTCGVGTELVNGKCQTIQKSTRIVIDQIPSTAYLGEKITISGKLTSNGKALSNAVIHIKDLDSFDSDDTIKKTMTDSNGKFTITWTVREMESEDRVAVAKIINIITNFIPEPSFQIAGTLTPIVNDFKNAVESSTVEFFAHYPGNNKYKESFSCGSSIVLGGILFNCSEPKILVILSNEDSTGARVLNKALVNLVPGITILTDDALFVINGWRQR